MPARPGSCGGVLGTAGVQRGWHRAGASPGWGGETVCMGTAWKHQRSWVGIASLRLPRVLGLGGAERAEQEGISQELCSDSIATTAPSLRWGGGLSPHGGCSRLAPTGCGGKGVFHHQRHLQGRPALGVSKDVRTGAGGCELCPCVPAGKEGFRFTPVCVRILFVLES